MLAAQLQQANAQNHNQHQHQLPVTDFPRPTSLARVRTLSSAGQYPIAAVHHRHLQPSPSVHLAPSLIPQPFPAPPHLMIPSQPYAFNNHSLSSQLPLFSSPVGHLSLNHSVRHPLHHHPPHSPDQPQLPPHLPPHSRRSSSASHNSAPSTPSESFPAFPRPTNKPSPTPNYPQPLYAQRPAHRGSNSSLPSSHHSRPSVTSPNGTNSRPPSIHTGPRPRTESAHSDRHSSRSRQESETSVGSRPSPRLPPTTAHSPTSTSISIAPIANHPLSARPAAMVRKPSPLAQTSSRSPAPPPGASPAAVPAPVHVQDRDRQDDTPDEPEQAQPPAKCPTPSITLQSSTTLSQVPPKPKGLGNKLRRALSIGAMHENMIQEEGGVTPSSQPSTRPRSLSSNRLLNSSQGASSATETAGSTKKGAGRRFGILNGRVNSSTDNLSISSTVSSASVMIRKLGALGRRGTSVIGLTKKFNKPEKIESRVTEQVAEEQEEEIEVEEGMTPAAAFIARQRREYAQREAEEAAAKKPVSQPLATKKAEKSPAVLIGSASGSARGEAAEQRKKMIEKEKERLKNKKGWKWTGFGGSSGGSAASATVPEPVGDGPGSDNETVRGRREGFKIVENGDDDDDDDDDNDEQGDDGQAVEELGNSREAENLMDEYDAASLFGATNGSTPSGQGSRPLPSRGAVPKKGILKNGKNFSQTEFLTPPAPSNPTEAVKTHSSASPSTPNDRPSSSVSPNPNESIFKSRRATFAQNLSVHSTWPPAIYDRKGGPATCNRLTPNLAQRIKEELNAFKMDEMEVHYSSRVHTHFFV